MDQLLERYYETHKRAKALQETTKQIKQEIENELERLDTNFYRNGDFTVERRKMKFEKIPKALCPSDIWEKYHTSQISYGLYIKKKGEKRSRSRSRD